jgi:iron complex transport system ATP-binding protein
VIDPARSGPIVARGVTVRAGDRALLDGVDLEVRAGEVVALVGPNGAGKSTLIGALAGDRALARGDVWLSGRRLERDTPPAALARLRAVLPQRSSLALAFTALEVVQLAAGVVPVELARRCLAEVELETLAARSYPTLSGGEQQRVQLARVLAQLALAPGGAVLLDEPTAALDPRHQLLVLGLARRLSGRGHPVVVAIHDLTAAARCCDRVALLERGRLVLCGSPDEVLQPARLDAVYGARFELLRSPGGLVVAVQ